MDNKTKTLIRVELRLLDETLNAYASKHNLSEEAMLDIKTTTQARISSIIRIFDSSVPFGTITKFED